MAKAAKLQAQTRKMASIVPPSPFKTQCFGTTARGRRMSSSPQVKMPRDRTSTLFERSELKGTPSCHMLSPQRDSLSTLSAAAKRPMRSCSADGSWSKSVRPATDTVLECKVATSSWGNQRGTVPSVRTCAFRSHRGKAAMYGFGQRLSRSSLRRRSLLKFLPLLLLEPTAAKSDTWAALASSASWKRVLAQNALTWLPSSRSATLCRSRFCLGTAFLLESISFLGSIVCKTKQTCTERQAPIEKHL